MEAFCRHIFYLLQCCSLALLLQEWQSHILKHHLLCGTPFLTFPHSGPSVSTKFTGSYYHYRLSFWTLSCTSNWLSFKSFIFVMAFSQCGTLLYAVFFFFYKRHILQDNSKNKGRKGLPIESHYMDILGKVYVWIWITHRMWRCSLAPWARIAERAWITVNVAWHWCFLLEGSRLMTFTSSLFFLAPQTLHCRYNRKERG